MAWFALFCLNERKTSDALAEIGCRAFYPTLVRYARQGHKWNRRYEPIFPRYIFAQTDAFSHDQLRAAGVIYVLGVNGEPRSIPDAVIDAVRDLMDSGALDQSEPVIAEKPKRIRYKGMQALRVWLDANRPAPSVASI